MGIFDFLKKKKKITKKENLTDHIILLMTKYLISLQSELLSEKSVSELKNEYTRLKQIGLGGTENARKIKDKLDFIQKEKDNRNLGQILLDYIKSIHDTFGITTYLISEEQFYELTKKYKLSRRLLTNFKGEISEDTISKIERIVAKTYMQNNLYLNQLSAIPTGARYFFVDQIDDRRYSERDGDSEIFELIHQHLDIICITSKYKSDYTKTKLEYDEARLYNEWMGYLEYGSIVDLLGKYLINSDLMVAAERSCFNEENPVIQGNPIIYQVCPYGVLVHLIIGEEADQGIFEEYQNLSNDLLG